MSLDPSAAGMPAVPTSDDKTWGMFAHLGGLIGSFIPALVIMLTKGNESPFVRAQAVEALNFQITLAIGWIVAIVLTFVLIGLLLMPVLIVGGLVLMIMAAVAVNKGEDYKYPINIRLVK